jgi:hypothetical protein
VKAGFLAALIAALVASAIVVVPALSTQSKSVPARVRALEAKVRVLQARVTRVTNAVGADEACAAYVLGTARYQGYVYTPDGGVTYTQTTAIDQTDAGETPNYYFQLISSNCVGGRSARHTVLPSQPRALRRHAR